MNKLADEYRLVLTGQGKNGAGGVVVAHWVTVARLISKSIPPPPPPRVMVNRGRSAVRVSVSVCRPNLSGAACSGFWCVVVWQSQSGRCVCYCSNGFMESPVQAALRSAGWEKSRDSSLRMTQNKALSFCCRDCYVPLCCIFILVVFGYPVMTFLPYCRPLLLRCFAKKQTQCWLVLPGEVASTRKHNMRATQ